MKIHPDEAAHYELPHLDVHYLQIQLLSFLALEGLRCVKKNITTLKCLSIGTPKTINFPFVPNGKLMVLDVPIFWHIIIKL